MVQSFSGSFLAVNFGKIIQSPFFWLGILVALLLAVTLVAIIITHRKFAVVYELGGETVIEKYRLGESFSTYEATKSGYIFGGWYLDEACSVRFIETVKENTKPLKLYAKWIDALGNAVVFFTPEKPQVAECGAPDACEVLPETVEQENVEEQSACETPIDEEDAAMTDEEYFKLFFESIKKEMLSYARIGDLASLGVKPSEIVAKMYLRDNSVDLYFAKTATINESNIELAIDGEADKTDTPMRYTVKTDEDFDTALNLINVLMTEKGLAFVGEPKEKITITDKEKQDGFIYEIKYDKVANSLSDYFLLIREFSRSFVLYEVREGLKNGAMLIKMYLKADAVYLYLATPPTGDKLVKSSFEDTPCELKVTSCEDVAYAYREIEKMMLSSGLERDNDSLNQFDNTTELKEGQGYGYRINF